MNKTYTFGVLFALALVATPALSSAQSITSRSTFMEYDAFYGGGPDTWDPYESITKSDVVLTDSSVLQFADTRAGSFPIEWTAGVSVDMTQSHTITGSLAAFETISASMQNTNTTFATGIGVAGIPGVSEQVIGFAISQPTNYRFEGSILFNNGGNIRRSIVELQYEFTFGWANIFSTAGPDLGPDASFSYDGLLEPGNYRIRNFAELQRDYNFTFVANNEYTLTNLDAVPEPASMLGLGAGLAALAARRRRRS